MTKIQWADKTWNPIRGCSIVSKGCTNCYAMKQAHRFSGPGGAYEGLTKLTNGGPVWTGAVRLVPEMLDQPLRWRKPRRVFVNSMSDLFHEKVTLATIVRIYGVMVAAYWHTFQVLTKRPKRRAHFFAQESFREMVGLEAAGLINSMRGDMSMLATINLAMWNAGKTPNIWAGVSVEDQETADWRIPILLEAPAAVRFVSYEPALEPVNFTSWLYCPMDIDDEPHTQCPVLDWIIVGGESGPRARPFDIQWARSVIDQCKAAGVPVFVKQLGAYPIWANTDLTPISPAHGKCDDMTEWPKELSIREYPA